MLCIVATEYHLCSVLALRWACIAKVFEMLAQESLCYVPLLYIPFIVLQRSRPYNRRPSGRSSFLSKCDGSSFPRGVIPSREWNYSHPRCSIQCLPRKNIHLISTLPCYGRIACSLSRPLIECYPNDVPGECRSAL